MHFFTGASLNRLINLLGLFAILFLIISTFLWIKPQKYFDDSIEYLSFNIDIFRYVFPILAFLFFAAYSYLNKIWNKIYQSTLEENHAKLKANNRIFSNNKDKIEWSLLYDKEKNSLNVPYTNLSVAQTNNQLYSRSITKVIFEVTFCFLALLISTLGIVLFLPYSFSFLSLDFGLGTKIAGMVLCFATSLGILYKILKQNTQYWCFDKSNDTLFIGVKNIFHKDVRFSYCISDIKLLQLIHENIETYDDDEDVYELNLLLKRERINLIRSPDIFCLMEDALKLSGFLGIKIVSNELNLR